MVCFIAQYMVFLSNRKPGLESWHHTLKLYPNCMLRTWSQLSEETCPGWGWTRHGARVNVFGLLLLLSRFSRVRLCATPLTAAYQAPPSLGFSRQEHWSGLPFPSPMHENESEVGQSCPTLRDPMDCSLPGSSIHGIFQARVLEWGAIAFSHQILWLCLNAYRDSPQLQQ